MALVSLNGVVNFQMRPIGDLMALGAMASWGLYSVLVDKANARGVSPLTAIRKAFFWALVMMAPLAVWGATEQGYYALDGSFSVTLDADINIERFSRPVNWVNIAFLGGVASAACFVLRSPQEAAGKVHVDDGEGEAVREQARRGEALLLQAPVMQLTQWRREGFPCRHEAV